MPMQQLEFGILNVVAHPHGPGIYRKILARAANREVNFWGDNKAAIRESREVEAGMLQSEIVIGTEIDLTQPLIDRASLEEVPADETDVRISKRHLYNGRVFLFTFNEKSHTLIFQSHNEFGKNLSPNRAQKIFSRLFSREILGKGAPDVDVTVVPEDDTLDRLLGLHRLDRVEIFLHRPNPGDVNADEVKKILAELEDQGAKSQDISLVRAPKSKGILLNAENYLRAQVAQYNGHVSASGLAEDGKRFNGSTKEYPKIIKVMIDAKTAITTTTLQVARRIKLGRKATDND